MPRDLKSITTIGEEHPAEDGLSQRTVEQIWDAVRELYRSVVHPAMQLCLRRHGRIVLNRAIGHAHGNVELIGTNYATGPKLLPPLSNLAARVLSRPVDEVVELSNDARFNTAILPAGNVIRTANELSRFFEIFRAGGELDGVQSCGRRRSAVP